MIAKLPREWFLLACSCSVTLVVSFFHSPFHDIESKLMAKLQFHCIQNRDFPNYVRTTNLKFSSGFSIKANFQCWILFSNCSHYFEPFRWCSSIGNFAICSSRRMWQFEHRQTKLTILTLLKVILLCKMGSKRTSFVIITLSEYWNVICSRFRLNNCYLMYSYNNMSLNTNCIWKTKNYITVSSNKIFTRLCSIVQCPRPDPAKCVHNNNNYPA